MDSPAIGREPTDAQKEAHDSYMTSLAIDLMLSGESKPVVHYER